MKVRGSYDVVVTGGGTAGAIAAIAAARLGARTLLVEQYGSIGGVLAFGMGFLGAADAEGYWALGGIGRELVDRLAGLSGATQVTIDPLFGSVVGQDPELTKIVLTDMCLEAGVQLLLHTFVADVLKGGARIEGLVLANKSGLEIALAKAVVDCTGDADVVARGGGEFTFGRSGDLLAQPVSCIFRVGGVDVDRVWDYLEASPDEMSAPPGWSGQSHNAEYLRGTPGAHMEGFQRLIAKAREAGDFTIGKELLGMYTFPGQNVVGINVTRVQGVNGTDPDDVTRAEIETRRQMLQAVRFLVKYVPGFEKAYIVSAPAQIGVRESRHVKGSYTLDKDDIIGGTDFPDRIGRGAYPLDIHDVKPGTAALNTVVKGSGIEHWKIHRSYSVPVRALVPLGLDNVVVGGRSISATHEAAASIRGQSVCMVTGHAAGAVAALTYERGVPAGQVPIEELQAVLRSQNAILDRNVRVASAEAA